MQNRRHVDRFVILVDAGRLRDTSPTDRRRPSAESRRRACRRSCRSHPSPQRKRGACSARLFGNAWICCQRVIAGPLHQAFHGQRPLVEIDVGIGNVVIVVGKLRERRDVVVAERLRQAMATEHFAEAQSLKCRPSISSESCSLGIANAPSAIRGTSFRSSRRLMPRRSREETLRISSPAGPSLGPALAAAASFSSLCFCSSRGKLRPSATLVSAGLSSLGCSCSSHIVP